jgi:hypothetical protein
MKRKLPDSEFSNTDIVSFYFNQQEEKSKWLCKCGKVRTQIENTGYSNLINHVKTAHSNWSEEVKSSKFSNSLAKYLFLPNDKAKQIHGWLDWIIRDGY